MFLPVHIVPNFYFPLFVHAAGQLNSPAGVFLQASTQSLPLLSFPTPVTVVSMTLPVWFTATPAKSGSATGVEIHLAGKWPSDGSSDGSPIVVLVLRWCGGWDLEFGVN